MNLKLKKVILFTLLFCSISLFAQTEAENTYRNNTLSLKLNTTAFIDVVSFPTFELSLEKRFNNYLGLQAEAGIQFYSLEEDAGSLSDTIFVGTNGIRFRLESRFYISDYINYKNNGLRKQNINFFSGLNLLYRRNTYNTNYNYNPFYNGNNINYINNNINDNIGVKKIAYGVNILFGGQFFIDEKIFIEPTIYLGFLNRNIKNIDRDTPKQSDLEGKLLASGYKDLQESSGKTLNLGFAIRLGINL